MISNALFWHPWVPGTRCTNVHAGIALLHIKENKDLKKQNKTNKQKKWFIDLTVKFQKFKKRNVGEYLGNLRARQRVRRQDSKTIHRL